MPSGLARQPLNVITASLSTSSPGPDPVICRGTCGNRWPGPGHDVERPVTIHWVGAMSS
jgi:hypothetical protein